MYNFIDTVEVSESALLPSEALKINGQYIEDLIPGYRTLYVKGREALSPELATYETGIRDGSLLKNRRYPARTITVAYKLQATDNTAFRNAFNALASILDVQDAELIFDDEADKFFIGTPSAIGEVEPGRNSVIGEFEILCVDPFKYSVLEYEAEPWAEDPTRILFDYGGTYKAFPKLIAEFYNETEVAPDGETATALTGNGDCGYVAFFNEYEKIIQLGDPDEADSEQAYEASQTLINQMFKVNTAWGTAGKAPWAINTGPVITQDTSRVGNVGMGIASYTNPAPPAATSGTLLYNAEASQGAPTFYYTVTASTSKRTATTVQVDVVITTRLKYSTSYFGRPYALTGSLYIGGAWRHVTIKSASEYWRGTGAHTAYMSFTVTGLSAGTTALTGIKFKATRADNASYPTGKLNETACSNLAVSPYASPTPSTYYLTPTSYGSGTGFHGPSMTRNIPADASGAVGAKNLTLTYKQKMSIGNGRSDTAQLGGFQCNLVDANGANVAGVRILKNTAGKSGKMLMYINGVKVHELQVDLSYSNKNFGTNASAKEYSVIEKFGNRIIFDIAGIGGGTFFRDEIEDVQVTAVTFAFEKYGSSAALSYNGLQEIKFVKNRCETYKDIPNKFSANDVLEADCKDGTIYLNKLERPDLGALGNDWEGFYLSPGLNQIGVAYSDWVGATCAPTLKVRYREVFI